MAVIDSAELLLQAKNYSGSGAWQDESGNGHHAQLGSTSGADTNDPQFDTDHFDLTTDDYFLGEPLAFFRWIGYPVSAF